jgi:hypothetical protein
MQPIINVEINGIKARTIMDTGSSISYCRYFLAHRAGFRINSDYANNSVKARTANGTEISFLGEFCANIKIGNTQIKINLLVSINKFCPEELLLGMDFVKNVNNLGMDLSFNVNKKEIKFGEEQVFMHTFSIAHELFRTDKFVNYITLDETTIVEPFSDYCIHTTCIPNFSTKCKTILILPSEKELGSHIIVGKSLCKKDNLFVRILNSGKNSVKLYKNMKIAKFKETDFDKKIIK